MSNAISTWFAEGSDWRKTGLEKLRSQIFSVTPTAIEALKWGQPCYVLNGVYCYLQRAQRHITLGFPQGTKLQDPGKALEGNGKQMRHLKFTSLEAIDEEMCTRFLREAALLDNQIRK